MTARCNDCGETLTAAEIEHGVEGYGHEGLCCDCHNLRCCMPLPIVNERRIAKGRPPLVEAPR